MSSSCCFCLLSLYWARSLSISGFKSCMARMLLTCLIVKGKSKERTITVKTAMLSHHGAPTEWKNSRPLPKTLIKGPKRLSRNSTTRSSSFYRVEPAFREGVTPEYPPYPHKTALQYTVLLHSE